MIELRVAKYDPSMRLETGRYLGDEWTSVSDIGGIFNGKVLTLDEYFSVEGEYVSAVVQFMQIAGVRRLTVSGLELHGCDRLPLPLREDCDRSFASIQEGQTVESPAITDIVRLALREAIWCRLFGDKAFYVHFGYDYYMYIGYDGDWDLVKQVSTSLCIEPFESPYHEQMEE